MALSPMMKQYLETKEKNPDCLLLFRLGDFYEMFFEDAVTASRELDLVLTGKSCGLEERAPMCGVPFHAVDSYVSKLIEKGYKVAICEQINVPQRGLADREVVRIVTPGTVMESDMLSPEKNNYLMSICLDGDTAGVCWADISTGEFNRATIDAQIPLRLNDLLARIVPAEIICNADMKMQSANLSLVKYGGTVPFQQLDETDYELSRAKEIIPQMCKDAKSILGEPDVCLRACGALLIYVKETQKRTLGYIRSEKHEEKTLVMDSGAIKTLELLASSDGKKQGSLFGAIDKTKTGMGARLLRKWISAPSLDEKTICSRLDGVEELVNCSIVRSELRELLSDIFDLERLAAKLAYGNFSPRECLSLAASLLPLPSVKKTLSECKSDILKSLGNSLDVLSDIESAIHNTINNEAPAHARDGGVILKGVNSELDEYRSITVSSKTVLSRIEAEQKQATGIRNLKVAFNSVFGYYIEVPKAQSSLVPPEYVRKQTTVNSERYITEELKIIEDKILHAEERALSLELSLYSDFLSAIAKQADRITDTAKRIALIDVLASNAEVSSKYGYCRPRIGSDIKAVRIKEGRHVVVERLPGQTFVPNDTFIDTDSRIMMITGPNMAGKSVYMRQVALIVILAHCGFFVPADSAEIPFTDKIFTRVGASDDLHSGRSTFMVEMSEVAYILENATDDSLILLDEVGRGTATYDGLSIAWAIVEYLSSHFKAKVMFSTHYHELTDLEDVVDGVRNYKITVRELAGNIVFMHKVLRGSANRSFGIEVAGLSGLPKDVVARAKELLLELEKLNIARRSNDIYSQMSMFGVNADKSGEILKILKELNLDDVSPRAAYDILSDLKEKAGE